MQILIIPDVHLKPYIFDAAEILVNKYHFDKIIFIGDLVDDWHKSGNILLVKETIDRAIKFKKDHPNTLFCYGNHETGYLTDIHCDGNNSYHYIDIREMLIKYEKEVEPCIAYQFDNVIFCHGGIVNRKETDKGYEAFKEMLNELKTTGYYNYGLYGNMHNQYDSVLWARPDSWINYYNCPQVIGHSPVKKICEIKPQVWDVDVFSTDRDTGESLSKRAFMSIDTETLDITIYNEEEFKEALP